MKSENLGFGWMVVNAKTSRMRDGDAEEGATDPDIGCRGGFAQISQRRKGSGCADMAERDGKRLEGPKSLARRSNAPRSGENEGSKVNICRQIERTYGLSGRKPQNKRVKVVKTRQQTSHRRVDWSACIGYSRLRRCKWLISRIYAGKTRD